ncbi:HAD family hydrolase [bacterium]|nr:HAD family hydrolase [bacterium]
MRPPGNIEAVLFDVGGTLVQPDYGVIQQLLAVLGRNASLASVKAAELQAKSAVQEAHDVTPWKAFFGGWFKALGAKDADLPQLFERLWQRHRRNNLWSGVAPDTLKTLNRLTKSDYRLGVISNSNGKIRELLESVGLAPYFEIVVDSKIVGMRKPDPAIFNFALSALNVRPERTLYIGDLYEIDFLGARNVGMNAILFDPQDHHDSPDCLKINRLSQVLNLVKSGRSQLF